MPIGFPNLRSVPETEADFQQRKAMLLLSKNKEEDAQPSSASSITSEDKKSLLPSESRQPAKKSPLRSMLDGKQVRLYNSSSDFGQAAYFVAAMNHIAPKS
jgi:hypothetical protein